MCMWGKRVMNSKEVQTIYLSVDRREQLILVDTILYAQVTDKLCTIHFTQGRPIRVFMTLAALSGMLPEDDFQQISRSCLVALKYVKNITDRCVVMSNGDELSYTSKKKTSLLLAFQQNLALRASSHAAISWRLDFSAEFRCFDRCPIPFFVLEKAADSNYYGSFQYLKYLMPEPAHSKAERPPRMSRTTYTATPTRPWRPLSAPP